MLCIYMYTYLIYVIFADLYFSAFHHNHQYYQNLVTAKIKCITYRKKISFKLVGENADCTILRVE